MTRLQRPIQPRTRATIVRGRIAASLASSVVPRTSRMASTPSNTTPNHGKTGTRSLAGGGTSQKPSQENSFSLKSGSA
ncbi:hypothetical protein D3C72_2008270 [compost metagenome]